MEKEPNIVDASQLHERYKNNPQNKPEIDVLTTNALYKVNIPEQPKTGSEALKKTGGSEISKEETVDMEARLTAERDEWLKQRKESAENKAEKSAQEAENTINNQEREVVDNPDAQAEDIEKAVEYTNEARKGIGEVRVQISDNILGATPEADKTQSTKEAGIAQSESGISSLLEEKRNAYVEAYQKSLQEKSGWGSAIKRVFSKEDGSAEELERLKSEYDQAKYEYCKNLIANKKAELEKRKMSDEKLEQALTAYKCSELYSKIFVNERDLLDKAKVESWPKKEKGIFSKGLDWWMRQGKGKRIIISTALITGLSFVTGGVAAGGFGATGLFFGSRIVKAFTSGLIAQGVGGVFDKVFSGTKAKKEWKKEEEESKEAFSKGKLTLEGIKDIEKQMRFATEKLEKSKRNKALAKGLTMLAVGAGSSIGLGLLGGAIMEIDAQQMETPPSGIAPEAGHIAEKISTVETASDKLNSVWDMAEHQLDQRGFFQGLSGSADEIAAKKTFIIDAIKDKVAENPSHFGLQDINKITSGQPVDFSDIFKNENVLKEALLAKADKLSDQDIAHILEYNKLANMKGVVSEAVNLQNKVVSSPTFGVSHEEYLGSLKEDLGLKLDEYDAIKDTKVEKFLDEISKYREGKVLDEEGMRMYPDLPHSGIYGGLELRHQIKLADRLKEILGTMPEKSSDMTVGEFVKKYTDSFTK